MRIFSHVTDFGIKGMQSIFPMAAIANRVVIWSPSAHYINQAKKNGGSPFTPQDILKLVNCGVITIMVRDWWLDEGERRKKRTTTKQEWYRWDPDFDGEIRAMAKVDKGKNFSMKRVIVEKEGIGDIYAPKVLENPEIKIHSRDLKYAKLLLDEGNFSFELARKLSSASSENDRLKVILEDIKNHRDAYKHSKAKWALIESKNASLYSKAIMSPVRIKSPKDLDIEQLVPLMRIISRLSEDTRPEKLLEILTNPELSSAKRDAAAFLQPGVNLSREIRENIEKNTPSLWKIVMGKAVSGTFSTLAGYLLNSVNTQVNLKPFWSFSLGAAPIAHAALEVANVVPASYEGITFPFIMAEGVSRPKHNQLRKVSKVLSELEQDDQTIT